MNEDILTHEEIEQAATALLDLACKAVNASQDYEVAYCDIQNSLAKKMYEDYIMCVRATNPEAVFEAWDSIAYQVPMLDDVLKFKAAASAAMTWFNWQPPINKA